MGYLCVGCCLLLVLTDYMKRSSCRNCRIIFERLLRKEFALSTPPTGGAPPASLSNVLLQSVYDIQSRIATLQAEPAKI